MCLEQRLISYEERKEIYNKWMDAKCAKSKTDIDKCFDKYIDSFLKK